MIPKYGLVNAAREMHQGHTQRTRETFHLYNTNMNFHNRGKPVPVMKHEDHSHLLHHSLLDFQFAHVGHPTKEHHHINSGFDESSVTVVGSAGSMTGMDDDGSVLTNDLDTSSVVTEGGTRYTWSNGNLTGAGSPHAVASRKQEILALPGISAAKSPNKVSRDKVTLVSAQNILERGSIKYFTSPSDHSIPETVEHSIPRLVGILKEGTALEKENAIKSLLFFVHEKQYLLRMYKYGIVPPLLAIKGNSFVYENSVRLLMNISNPPEIKISMYQSGTVIPVLLQLLKSCSERARNYAIGVMHNLSMGAENKVHMYHKSGVLPPLIRIQRDKEASEETKERIFGVFLNLSIAPENKVHLLIATNILPHAVKCYQAQASTAEVVENMTGLMYYLTDCDTNKPIAFEAGIAPLLLQLCVKGNRQSSETTKEYAVGALWHMASVSSIRSKLVALGTIPVLVELLKLCNDTIRRNSSGLLGEIAQSPELRPTLVQTPGLCAAFISMLSRAMNHSFSQVSPALSYCNPSHDGFKEEATRALVSLTDHSDTRKPVYQSGIVACLIQTLTSSTETTMENTLQVLYNLSIAGANKVPMLQAGVIPPVLDLVGHGTLLSRELGAGILSNLSRTRDNKLPMIRAGVLPYLISCISPGSGSTPQTVQQVAGCFMRLSDEDGVEVPVVEAGAIPHIMHVVRGVENSNLAREFATEAMYNICVNPQMREEAKKCGVERLDIGWTSTDW